MKEEEDRHQGLVSYDCSQRLWCPEVPGLCLVNWWVGYKVAVDNQRENRAQRL